MIAAVVEASDSNAPGRRAAAGHSAGREVHDDALTLERDATDLLLRRLGRLKRELQGAIAAAGGSGYRSFTAATLIREIDQLFAAATADMTDDARARFSRAFDLGTAAVDSPLAGARVSVGAAPRLDRTLVTHAFDTNAELLTTAMQQFRNQVVQGVRRASVAGASSFDQLRALAGSIDKAGFDGAAFKAERIMRTEMGRVFSGATYDRLLQLSTSLPFLRKGWRSAKDGRTRKGHLEAATKYARGNGIPIRDPFLINVYQEFPQQVVGKLLGVAKLRYPIDPEASPAGRIAAGATIMCRCNMFADFNLDDLRAFSTSRTTVPAHEPTMPRGFAEPPIASRPAAPRPPTRTTPPTIQAPPPPTARVDHLDPALTGEGRELGVNADRLKQMVRDTQQILGRLTQAALPVNRVGTRVTLEDVKAHVEQMDAHVRKLIQGSDQFIRVNRTALEGVLEAGRFKSQFETSRSGGLFDPDYRAEVEEKLWGLPRNLPREQRPIYGYMDEARDGFGPGAASSYGEIAVKLKPGVRQRSTFTFGDSFGLVTEGSTRGAAWERFDGIRSAPSLVSRPRYWAWNPEYSAGGELQDVIDSVRSVARPGRRPYTETQIFGGVNISDIEMVIFDRGLFDLSAITAKLDKLGIPWTVRER